MLNLRFSIPVSHLIGLIAICILATASAGCETSSDRRATNTTNSGSTSNRGDSTSAAPRFFAKELDPYSARIQITRGSEPPAQVDVARMRGDRRWSLQLPGVGDAVYLEKAGIKYFMLPGKKQYTELAADALGFVPAQTLTPIAIVEKLVAGAQIEKLGKEVINGRVTNKYRVTPATSATSSTAGLQNTVVIYVDEGNGLPIRVERSSAEEDVAAPVFVDTLDVQLNPDPGLFEVPIGTKKVVPEQLRSQSQRLIESLQRFAKMMGHDNEVDQPAVRGATDRRSGEPPANSNSRKSR